MKYNIDEKKKNAVCGNKGRKSQMLSHYLMGLNSTFSLAGLQTALPCLNKSGSHQHTDMSCIRSEASKE